MRGMKTLVLLALPLALAARTRTTHHTVHGLQEPTLEAKVDRLFAPWDREDSPGCAVAVFRDGRMLYQRGYGMADLERGIRNTPATVFHVGSMAKQFTALCIFLLVQERKLSLDDDVRKYLPEVPDYGEKITLRHLLHHTSGLREHHNLLQLAGWRWRDLITERDVLTILSRQRGLNFRPGEEFLYSNSNYVLLAVVIKRVTGKSLRDFARERIFQPLGMSRTQVVQDHAAVVPGRATGHVRRDEGGYDAERPAYDFAGSTNVLTTVEDLAKWDANFYEPKVGNKEIMEQLTAPGHLRNGDTIGYGGGLFLGTYRQLPIISHAGADIGFRAELLRFPNQRFSVVVLGNLFEMSPTRLAQQVADLYLAETFPTGKPQQPAAAVATPSAADLNALGGLYWNERLATFRRFTVQQGQLQMMTSEGPYALVPIGKQEFQLPVAPRRYTFTFLPGGSDRPPRVRENIEGQRSEEFVSAAEVKPTLVDLAAYAGAYVSDELGVVWNVEVRDGQLLLHRRKFRDSPMKPVLADVFETGGGTLQFQRSGDRRITGFTVTTERVRHLRFLKVE
jgi:CubicO group peptidase (beta-lactamase class C family)